MKTACNFYFSDLLLSILFIFISAGGHTVFQHYSVSGYPCKRGTKCERNKIAGFWSCETEGSEFGSWDYCCEPTSHCGFSKGFNYPW